MPITVQTLRAAVDRSQARIPWIEGPLNAADAVLGDGDTGSMLARVIGNMAATDWAAIHDLGAAFTALARATLSATGSSLGTLLATGLLAMGKSTRDRGEIPWTQLPGLIEAAIAAMKARGGADLGDKTILDVLHGIAHHLEGTDSASDAAQAAAAGARAALERFKPLPCKIGRARLFPDRSAGAHDPGMLAIHWLVALEDGGIDPSN